MALEPGYYRHPTIAGDTVVFVSEDDLWQVSCKGGRPRRLTAGPGTSTFPVLSADGRRIAFTGRDDGPAEAYVLDLDGGSPRRLTWFGAFTATVGWSRDGRSVIVASDVGQPFRGSYHLHEVPLDGGPSRALGMGPARAISFQPDGPGVVIGRNSGDPARWKRYRGGTAGTLWVDRRGDGEFVPLLALRGNLATPMWIGARIWFLSDHEGHGNLYSCTPDGKDLRRHTGHEDFYVRFPHSDGRRVVHHAGADLHVVDVATGVERKLEIEGAGPRAGRARRFVPAARHVEDVDVHPDGHSLACVARGGLFTTGLWDGAPARLGAGSGVRHRLARWLPDGKRLVALSDEGGEEALVVVSVDPETPSRRLELDVGRALDLVVAPAGADRLALANQRQELIVVDLAAGTARTVDRSPFDRIEGLAWSADGRWLAYGLPTSQRTCAIRLFDSVAGTTHDVTRPDFRDGSPSFDPEGRYLYFTSYRVFDPVYDSQYFDLGFPRGSRPHLVTLRKDIPSPFSAVHRAPRLPAGTAVPEGRPPEAAAPTASQPVSATAAAASAAQAPAAGAPTAGAPTAAAPAAPAAAPAGLRIDLDGIADRVVAFPVGEGRYGAVAGVRGRVAFCSYPIEGSLDAERRGSGAEPPARGTLEVYDFADDKVTTLSERVTSFEVSGSGRSLVLRSGHRVRVLPAGIKCTEMSPRDEASRETGWVDLERLRVAVVPGLEWRQMFREAWRLQRDQFWTPDMSGIDWRAVHDRYLPLVDRVATRGEFSDVVWEMQGELGTSHCYEMGGDYRPEPTWYQGFLGADLAFDAASSTWRIARVPRGDSWDAMRASPLAAPGLDARVGDEILDVDGEPVGRTASPMERLVALSGRDVRIGVRTPGGPRRQLSVRTLRDEQPLRYRDWVEANRARVHAETQGRVGYVHVPNMGPLGYSEFHRYYAAEVERDALLVDVRWNGGGHVSQLLLEKLARRPRGFNQSRWRVPAPYPGDAPRGPVVALTNEYAGSDGDIFSHCFKLFGLGPLIGKRTWGGVVGIWPRHALVDGTVTTQPEFAFWFRDVGYDVEGHGTDPDIEVEIRPQDHRAGRDPQLDRGIAEALALLAKQGPVSADLAKRPVRRPPTLPKLG